MNEMWRHLLKENSIDVIAVVVHFEVIGPSHDPIAWYGINYAGTQVTQWDFQNKGNSYQSSPTFLCFESPTV